MVKVSGPMMSLDASGKLGDAIVFSKWKGRNYVRQLVKPSNPKSGLQTGMRAMWGYLSQRWVDLSAGEQATWEPLAEQLVASPFNAYMRQNQRFWRDFTAPAKFFAHNANDNIGITPTNSATDGVRSITISTELATVNDNWGMIVFKSTTTGFTPSLSNAVKVLLVDTDAVAAVYVDSPLVPDEYFYNFIPFTVQGLLGTALGEVSADAT